MEIAALAANAAALATCMVGLGVVGFLWFVSRATVFSAYLRYLGVATGALVAGIAGAAVALASPGPLSPSVQAWLQLPALFVMAGFMATAPRFHAAFAETEPSPHLVRLLRVWAVATVLLAPVTLLPPEAAPLPYLPPVLALAGFLTAMIASQAIVIRRHAALSAKLHRIGVPAIIGFNIVCIAAGTADSIAAGAQRAAGDYPAGLLAQPVLYTAWNVLTIAWVALSQRAGLLALNAPGQPRAALSEAKARSLGLTERELELAAAVAAGDSNKEIADRLGISPHTVRNHLANIFGKTGARNRVELVGRLRGD